MAPKAVLVGMPGSGKSTIGRRLAKAMGVTLLDTDAEIVARTGRAIAEIFDADGEAGFRRIEEEVVKSALTGHDGIVSLGGGAVTSPGVREALSGHTVIFLEIGTAEGIRRTSYSDNRPLLAGDEPAERYRALMRDRVPLYRRVATMRVNTNRRNPGAVVRYLADRLEHPAPAKSTRRRRRRPWRPDPAVSHPRQSEADAEGQAGRDVAAAPAAPAPDPPTPATPAALAARRTEARK